MKAILTKSSTNIEVGFLNSLIKCAFLSDFLIILSSMNPSCFSLYKDSLSKIRDLASWIRNCRSFFSSWAKLSFSCSWRSSFCCMHCCLMYFLSMLRISRMFWLNLSGGRWGVSLFFFSFKEGTFSIFRSMKNRVI